MLRHRIVFTLVLALCAASLAHAGAPHMDCSAPFVFPGSDVNVVVLPYAYAGASQRLNETGRRISLLIQEDTLLNILGYGSVASVQLEPSPGREEECQPGIVLRKLLGRQPNLAEVRSGKGLVLVWGLIYEESGEIYLKTYASAIQRDVRSSIELKFGKFNFNVSPSAHVIGFPPRQVSRKQLDEIESAYASADRMFSEPRVDASSQPLPRRNCPTCPPGDSQGYYVEDRRGDWVHIRLFDAQGGMQSGWIRAGAALGPSSLDTFIPELYFVRGSVGYLLSRINPGSPSVVHDRELATGDLLRYLKSDERLQSESASAVALELCGIMQILGDGSPASWAKAIDYFERARSLVPDNPEARNVMAVGHIYQDWLSGKWLDRSRDRAQELIDATLLRPGDPVPLQNLTSYYQLLLPKAQTGNPPSLPTALSADDIQSRLKLISATRDQSSPPAGTKPPN